MEAAETSEEDEEDAEEEAEDEKKDEEAISTKRLVTKAVLMLLAGTIVCAVFSDPMVDAVSNFSTVSIFLAHPSSPPSFLWPTSRLLGQCSCGRWALLSALCSQTHLASKRPPP